MLYVIPDNRKAEAELAKLEAERKERDLQRRIRLEKDLKKIDDDSRKRRKQINKDFRRSMERLERDEREWRR